MSSFEYSSSKRQGGAIKDGRAGAPYLVSALVPSQMAADAVLRWTAGRKAGRQLTDLRLSFDQEPHGHVYCTIESHCSAEIRFAASFLHEMGLATAENEAIETSTVRHIKPEPALGKCRQASQYTTRKLSHISPSLSYLDCDPAGQASPQPLTGRSLKNGQYKPLKSNKTRATFDTVPTSQKMRTPSPVEETQPRSTRQPNETMPSNRCRVGHVIDPTREILLEINHHADNVRLNLKLDSCFRLATRTPQAKPTKPTNPQASQEARVDQLVSSNAIQMTPDVFSAMIASTKASVMNTSMNAAMLAMATASEQMLVAQKQALMLMSYMNWGGCINMPALDSGEPKSVPKRKLSAVVYVKGFDQEQISLEQLTRVFQCFGEVENSMLHRKKDYALVKFTNIKGARACIRELYGKQIGGCSLLIHYSEFEDLVHRFFSNEKVYFQPNKELTAIAGECGTQTAGPLLKVRLYALPGKQNTLPAASDLRQLLSLSAIPCSVRTSKNSNELELEFLSANTAIDFAKDYHFREMEEHEVFSVIVFPPL